MSIKIDPHAEDDLLSELLELADQTGDPEATHARADDALLEYIARTSTKGPAILVAFHSIKWSA